MMDEADISQARMEHEEALRERNRKPYTLPEGSAGDCDLCGEWCGRLVGGVCAPVPRQAQAAVTVPAAR